MKLTVKALAIAVILVLFAPTIIHAVDYITEAAQALERVPVYVAPGTERTNNDTAGKLQARLEKDDNIVLVMLPEAAEAEIGVDINTIASRLSEQLGNKRIIGLAVGRKVVGYAPTLPVGVGADQMRRAESVSNDSFTALDTFVQNMHIWLADHPQPIPPPFETAPKEGRPWWLISIASAIVALLATTWLLTRRGQNENERTRFDAPDQVKDLLAKIVRDREKVRNPELQHTLYQMCLDIEKYFQSNSKDKGRDSLFFKDRLTDVYNVLTKYIDVQGNRRYYEDPEDLLRTGGTAIRAFAHYVLESIRRGHAVDLVEYSVNTRILEAQRHRR